MLTTAQAAALLNARKAEQGETTKYTGKHIARLCARGKVEGTRRPTPRGPVWEVEESSVEAYATTEPPKGGRPRKGDHEHATRIVTTTAARDANAEPSGWQDRHRG